ncbi:hypothetical protein HDA32_002510 [Spinactinospora alkalitolerans]|uniref:Uncharacterized protein n=1 Tax=Spinactinospora alkalitolerans TaxID=687207 RepID=A0A852U035_9ACTN|nr:hypothetical protein [Spinactinospora alkalitolerans]NYE47390.1 hypothetical protein [Spinactinospora alkalitolerans]
MPLSHADASGPVYACGTAVLHPGDADYDFYAVHATPSEEHQRRRRRDPVRAAELKAEFKKRYEREHGRRSA